MLVTFLFLLSKESIEEEVPLPHMEVGGMLNDPHEVNAQPLDPAFKAALLQTEYPRGLAGLLEAVKAPQGLAQILEAQPYDDEALLEIKVSRLSSILINGCWPHTLPTCSPSASIQLKTCPTMQLRAPRPRRTSRQPRRSFKPT